MKHFDKKLIFQSAAVVLLQSAKEQLSIFSPTKDNLQFKSKKKKKAGFLPIPHPTLHLYTQQLPTATRSQNKLYTHSTEMKGRISGNYLSRYFRKGGTVVLSSFTLDITLKHIQLVSMWQQWYETPFRFIPLPSESRRMLTALQTQQCGTIYAMRTTFHKYSSVGEKQPKTLT